MSQAIHVRTAEMPIKAIRQYPGNAKQGDVAAILESLRSNGQYRAIVVREHGGKHTSLAGNHTVLAIALHGRGDCGIPAKIDGKERPCGLCRNTEWDPVARCDVITCDENTALRINLADNRTSELGGHDEHALALLLAELDGDLTGTGYSDSDLEDLLTALDQAAAVQEDYDDEPEQTHAATTPDALPADGIPAGPAPGEPAPPLPAGHATLFLTYTLADREEIARLVHAARELIPDTDAADLILRALRTLVALLDARHAHDGMVTATALLKAAGVDT